MQEVHDGFFLYVPRAYHYILMFFLFITCVLVLIPATFLFKQAIFLLVALMFVQFALVALLWGQSVARGQVDEEIDGRYYWKSHHAFDMTTAIVAGVAALFIALAAGFAISGIVGCVTGGYSSDDSFLNFLFNTSNITEITTVTDVWRRPDFATNLSWYQMCLDDEAYTIAFIVIAGTMLILDVMIFAYEVDLRQATVRIHMDLQQTARTQHVQYHLDPSRNPVFGTRITH